MTPARTTLRSAACWSHRFWHHFNHTWLDRGGPEGDLMDQRTLIALQQRPADRVVPVGTIGRGDQRAGVYHQHLIAPEPLGQHFIGLCRAAT